MSLPTERPTFVLPWIAVILASFAALPVCFGGREHAEDGAVDVLGLPSGAVAGELLGPNVVPAPHPLLRADGREDFLPYSAAEAPEGYGPAEESGEVASEELAVQAAERVPEAVASPVLSVDPGAQRPEEPMEFRNYLPSPRQAVAAADARGSARRTVARRPAGKADAVAATQGAPARLRALAGGRVELRLTPQAVAFLLQQDLLPTGVALRPAVAEESAVADATLAEAPEGSAPLSKAERRQRFKRLVNSDPRRLLEFLADLTPAQLRELCQALRGRGVNVEQFLGA